MELKLAAITAHNGVLPHCLPYTVFGQKKWTWMTVSMFCTANNFLHPPNDSVGVAFLFANR